MLSRTKSLLPKEDLKIGRRMRMELAIDAPLINIE